VGGDATVNLEAFRDAVLAEARASARALTDEADREARERIEEATRRADQQRERARHQGRETAERAAHRERSRVRRQARQQVLRARRAAVDDLREAVLARLGEQRGSPAHRALLEGLTQQARGQLGAGAEIEPREDGVVAHLDGRSVDYRLPVLVDRAIEDLGAELEELWR
jgi:vacuolar-type H+-ATPase subunit E/Vma4